MDPGIAQRDRDIWVMDKPYEIIQKNELLREGKSIPAHRADIKHVEQGPQHESQKPQQRWGNEQKEGDSSLPGIPPMVIRARRENLFVRDYVAK
jgi:hypothetical protein